MSEGAPASARAVAYGLLADLLVYGPGGHDAETLAAFGIDASDREAIEAQFVTAFDLGIPPYASVFLESDGTVGKATTLRIADEMAAYGPTFGGDDVAPCHLGAAFGHAARLCADGHSDAAADFLRRHVLSWLPSYLAALERAGTPDWCAVVAMGLDVACEHVGGAELEPTRTPLHVVEPSPLADERTGLREVAEFLASPVRCGMFVTDAEARAIGRTLDLPRGFGSRRQRLQTMLGSAAEYEMVGRLCDAFDALAQARIHRLRELSAGRFDPSVVRPWIAKLQATRKVLATLRDGAQTHATERTTA